MVSLPPSIRRGGTTMWRKVLSVSLVLALTGAFVSAGTVQARPGGGGHGGGGHIGGFRGGAHFGGFRPGAPIGASHHPRSYHPGYSYRYPRGWPYYPYYPYSYPVRPNYSNLSSGYGEDEGSADESSRPGYTQKGDSAARTTRGDEPARVTVTLPADALLWMQGQRMMGSGATREFTTPDLDSRYSYSYELQASWKDRGRTVDQTQTVTLTAGAHVKVHFPVPPAKANTAPKR
jgi:uncharacterized protein (TIGR03000 family)